VTDTDGDGIPDGFDLAPHHVDGSVDHHGTGGSAALVTVSIVELGRTTRCEPTWGNRWDPYIRTAFISVPGVGNNDFTDVGFNRMAHVDDRPSGELETRPSAALALPHNVQSYGLAPGQYPSLKIRVGMEEHDTFGSDTISLAVGMKDLDLAVPIWTPTAGQILGDRFTGDQGDCQGDIKIEWTSDLLRTEVIAAVMADARAAVNAFLTADELSDALTTPDCTFIAPHWPFGEEWSGTKGRGSGSVADLCSAAVSTDLAPPPVWVHYLDLEVFGTPWALLDLDDPEHPVRHHTSLV
jgi:hypothetical protein